MKRLEALWTRLQATTPLRAWKRYGDSHGNILAGGVGYFAFFSLFPAAALAVTVFGFVLRGRPDLVTELTQTLDRNVPGLIKDAQHPQGLVTVAAPGADALTLSGIVSLAGLLLSGLGWLSSLRESIRAIFGLDASPGNPVTTKLRDTGVLLTLGVGVAASALLTSAVGSAASWISARVGLGGNGWVVTLAGLLLGAVLDTGLMLLLLRVLTGIDAPWRVMLRGAVLGGVGFTLVKLFASALIGRASHNPLFASVAIVVGLLFWLNLISRLVLVAAAWAANDVDAYHSVSKEADPQSEAAAAGRALAAAERRPQIGPRAEPVPVTFGPRAADRVTLAAGAVLGASAAVAVAAAVRALHAVGSVLRVARRR